MGEQMAAMMAQSATFESAIGELRQQQRETHEALTTALGHTSRQLDAIAAKFALMNADDARPSAFEA